MDYGKIYEDYYSNYYDKLELFAKDFFIKNHTEGITFNYTHNEFSANLHSDFCSNITYLQNEVLTNLYSIFQMRATIYPIDYNQKIFGNKIKPEFDKIDLEQLPKNYNFIKYIEEIAFIESRNEISRLVSNNSRLLVMVYKLARFDIFEIRYYDNLPLEEYPYYKELESELYPEDEESINLKGVVLIKELSDDKNPLPLLFLNSDVFNCFMEYQKHILDFYIDYSYLKKRLDKEKLIHYHKDNDFMKIIFEDLRLLNTKKYEDYCEVGKLKSLDKSYSVQRQNNFNIIFNELI
jgi:hypothetical protein